MSARFHKPLALKRSLLFLILLIEASCAPTPASPAPLITHRMGDNPYLKLAWSMDYPTTTLVAATDRIITQGPQGLAAIDTWSSIPVWTDRTGSSGKLFIEGSTLYHSLYDGLEAYDVQSGKVLWETRSLPSGNARGLTADASSIFLTDQFGRLLILDSRGRFIRALEASVSRMAILLEGNTLYYFDPRGLQSLSTEWNKPGWDTNLPNIRLALASGKAIDVLSGSPSGAQALYAVQKSDGKILWRWNEPSPVVSNLCFLDSSLFYLTANGRLVVLSALTGKEVVSIAFTNVPLAPKDSQPLPVQYQLAADPGNDVLAIAFGDSAQLLVLKLLGSQEVFIEKPLYR